MPLLGGVISSPLGVTWDPAEASPSTLLGKKLMDGYWQSQNLIDRKHIELSISAKRTGFLWSDEKVGHGTRTLKQVERTLVLVTNGSEWVHTIIHRAGTLQTTLVKVERKLSTMTERATVYANQRTIAVRSSFSSENNHRTCVDRLSFFCIIFDHFTFCGKMGIIALNRVGHCCWEESHREGESKALTLSLVLRASGKLRAQNCSAELLHDCVILASEIYLWISRTDGATRPARLEASGRLCLDGPHLTTDEETYRSIPMPYTWYSRSHSHRALHYADFSSHAPLIFHRRVSSTFALHWALTFCIIRSDYINSLWCIITYWLLLIRDYKSEIHKLI